MANGSRADQVLSRRQSLFPILASTVTVLIALGLSMWRLYHPPLSPRFERWMDDGYSLLSRGWYGKAEQAYLRALSLDGRNIQVQRRLEKTRLFLNDDVEYVEKQAFRWLKKTHEDPHLYILLGKVAHHRGQYSEAKHYYQQALQLDRRIATAWYGLGRIYVHLEKWHDAQRVLEQAVNIAKNQRHYLELLADVYYQQEKYEAAVNVYRRLIADDLRVFLPYYRLASNLRLLGNQAEALAILEQVAQKWNEKRLVVRLPNQNAWTFSEHGETIFLITTEAKRDYGVLSLSLTRYLLGKNHEADQDIESTELQHVSSEVFRLFGLELDRLIHDRSKLTDLIYEFAEIHGLLPWMSGSIR